MSVASCQRKKQGSLPTEISRLCSTKISNQQISRKAGNFRAVPSVSCQLPKKERFSLTLPTGNFLRSFTDNRQLTLATS